VSFLHPDAGKDAQTIMFPNGNSARVVIVPPGTHPESILKALGIVPARAVIVMAGGAANIGDAVTPELFELLKSGIARAAWEEGAIIIDGGTHAGVMEMMGRGVKATGRKTTLLGVAPAGRVTYPPQTGREQESISLAASEALVAADGVAPLDPDHSHFVLVEGAEWGDETATMYDIVSFLGAAAPSVAVLADGGRLALAEVGQNIQAGREIIVITGSGRLADGIARTREGLLGHARNDPGAGGRASEEVSDKEVKEIAAYDHMYLFSMGDGPDALAHLIKQKLARRRP
jgi:hypothetical protein